jgi:hypothetical protein
MSTNTPAGVSVEPQNTGYRGSPRTPRPLTFLVAKKVIANPNSGDFISPPRTGEQWTPKIAEKTAAEQNLNIEFEIKI